MNGWIAGALLLSIWLYGLLILRGIGDCITRLHRIEVAQGRVSGDVKGIRREANERHFHPRSHGG